MSDTSDPNSNPNPESPVSADDLEQVFDEWNEERSADDATDDLDLALDEPIDEESEYSAAEQRVAKSRRGVRNRLLFMLLLSVVGVLTCLVNLDELAYYFADEGELLDLGDVRRAYADRESSDAELFDLEHNQWIRFQNTIPTEERETDSGTQFFFDPILKAVVVTERALPEKNPRNAAISYGLIDLVSKRWIFPRDLSVAFSGQGRLLKASQAPRKYRPVVELYQRLLNLESRLGQDNLWLILDDHDPPSYAVYLYIYLVTILVIGLSLWFFIRARKRHAELIEWLLAQQSDQS